MQLGISTYTYGWAVKTATAYRLDDRSALPIDEQTLLDRAVIWVLD